ncbi:peptidase M48 [Rhodoferax aquaticus]|uniref:Peptidase M48 n=2 Tax=Rhodoferax aquaticus TaxID=2527691 RepID=A0A515EVA8_9BURK|nr:peptidase M48 [Rhodoferax aquaticus]
MGSANVVLPNLGDTSSMSPAAERKLGDRIARELYRDPDYIDDPVIMEFVQAIWQPLLSAARQRGELPPELDEAYAWEILLGRDRRVNAFALPGAYMGLHLGLVGVVSSRDELASVMAHELSHVTQRHISRMMSRQAGQAPWVMGAMILGLLAASKDPRSANALIVGGQAAGAQTQLNFSRDMEREADRVGYSVLTQAGFAPQGFVGMFEKLQQASRLNDAGDFPYLRSHPVTTERISDMQLRLPDGAASLATRAAPTDLAQAMVSARARVVSNTEIDALRAWEPLTDRSVLNKQSAYQQSASLYGASLAAIKLRDYAAAQKHLALLSELTRADLSAARLVRLLAAELALAQGQGAKALVVLNAVPTGGGVSANQAHQRGRAEMLLIAQAQLQTGGTTGLAEPLQQWLAEHPRDAWVWQVLSSVYSAQGRAVAAVRAQAESNVAQLDYAGAAARFRAAQELARQGTGGADHFEASIVDSRARQVEALLREQAVER